MIASTRAGDDGARDDGDDGDAGPRWQFPKTQKPRTVPTVMRTTSNAKTS